MQYGHRLLHQLGTGVSFSFWRSLLFIFLVSVAGVEEVRADDSQTLTDSDGDVVTLQLKGAGAMNVTLIDPDMDGRGPIDTITLTGVDAASSLTIKVSKVGDAHISIGNIVSDGPLKSIAGKTADLVGGDGIDIDGFLGGLTLAQARDSMITLSGAGVPAGGLALGKLTIAGTVRTSVIFFLIPAQVGVPHS